MKFLGKPVSLGLSLDGRVVEVLKSPGGTWTIIMTSLNGVSCLLIAGKYWQNVVIAQPNGVSCLIAAGQDWEELPNPEMISGTQT